MSDASKLLTPAASDLARQRTEEFSPRRFLRNGHLQTLLGNFLPRQYVLPQPEAHIIEVDPGEGVPRRDATLPEDSTAPGRFAEAEAAAHARGASYVLCHCHWQATPSQCLTVLLVHGLEGSSRSQYVLGNSARAWEIGRAHV